MIDDSEQLDHVDLYWSDGSIDQMDQIPEYKFTFQGCDSGCYNLELKNSRLTTFKDRDQIENEKKPIERYIEEEQMIGRMAAISAVWVRIERGCSIDDLKDFIKEEHEEYRKWFDKYRS